MAFYTSHIYLQVNETLMSFLKSDPRLSPGLFHLRHLPSKDKKEMNQNRYPPAGIVVIREVCDPNKIKDDHDEARVHQKSNAPIISWWNLQGRQSTKIIYPSSIPTVAFGKVYLNHENNPPPPPEFLGFLKELSLTYNIPVAFYHKYSAYEDELAMAEYAWLFGAQDVVYIRHLDGLGNITQFLHGSDPKIMVDSGNDNYSQPIFHLLMKGYGVNIERRFTNKHYFYRFNWDDYRI